MNREILTVVDVVSNEKGVSKEIIFDALEAALASATKKRFREDIGVRVAIDRETGEYDAFQQWQVIDPEAPPPEPVEGEEPPEAVQSDGAEDGEKPGRSRVS